MKRLPSAVILIVGWFSSAAAAPPDEPALERLRNAKTIRLTVEQTYLYTARENSEKKIITGFRLPYASVVRDLLEGAGLRVIEPRKGESGDHDAVLEITAHGRAIARFYDDQAMGYLYTGAEIIGDIAFSTPGAAPWHTAFRSVHGPPLNVHINLGYDRPSGAPFAEAFGGPLSFTSRIVEVIGRLYGARPLIAALDGSDAVIRRHATKTLGTVGGDAAGAALLAMMTDNDPLLRKEAAWSLGRLRDHRGVDALTLALEDRDADVRWFAAWALEKIHAAY